MQLDLRINGKLCPDEALLLNEIADEIRVPFADYIGQISEPYRDNLDWWVAGPASRNTLVDPLYYQCIRVHFLQRCLSQGKKYTRIIVDNADVKKTIQPLLQEWKSAATISVSAGSEKGKSGWLLSYRRFLKSATLHFYRRYCATISQTGNQTEAIGQPAVLIDTFVAPGHIESDRTYTGLWEQLSNKKKESVYFVPNLFGFSYKDYKSVFQQLRKPEGKFLIKEDFLKLRDYLFALGHFFRVFRIKTKFPPLLGIDISPLVKADLLSFDQLFESVLAFLNLRFIKRLKEKKIPIQRLINRFENQVIDKGWNAGCQRYFPEVTSVGYQGFVNTVHYLCSFPTEAEFESRVLPQKMAVIGKGHIHPKMEFCKSLEVISAPAFRFRWLWQERTRFPQESFFTILVALPIVVDEGVALLKILHQAIQELSLDQELRIWVKPHPTISRELIETSFEGKWPELFEFKGGGFDECVEQSDLMIGNLSSTCLETIARGIPVIIAGNPTGLTHNPIPPNIASEIWQLCNSVEETREVIKQYASCNKEQKRAFLEEGNKIREEYFVPVTSEAVLEFLGIEEEN